MISYRFDLGFLNMRHRYASQIARTFKWDHPNFEVPDLPNPAPPVTTPCSLQASSSSAREKRVEARQEEREGPGMGSPEWRRYLDRVGIEVQRSSAVDVFGNTANARALDALWKQRMSA
jgi:hypothetical protein